MMEKIAKQVASSSASLVVRRISVLATTAVSTAVIARMLDTEDYGQLQASLAVWAIALTTCEFGFGPVLSREFTAQAERRPALLRAGRDLQGLLGLLGLLGFVGAGVVVGVHSTQGQIYLALAPSVAFAAYSGGRSYFLAVFETQRLVRIDVTVALVQCAAVVAVAVTTNSPVLIALTTGVAMAVNTAWVGIAAQRRLGAVRADRATYRTLTRQVLPLGLSSVISRIYLSIDLVLLGWLALDSETAYYAGAVKIVAFLNTLTGLVVSAALPGLSALRDDPEAMLKLAGRLMSWVSVTVLPCFVITAVFARTACQVLLGDKFEDAAPLVVILVAAGIVAAASQVFGALLTAVDVVKPMLFQNLVGVIINVAGNLVLIPRYGAYASAGFTLLTELIVCGGSLLTLSRRFPVGASLLVTARPLVAVAVAGLTGALLVDQPWAGIPASLLVLAVMFRLLHCWPAELVPQRFRRPSVEPAVLAASEQPRS